jgi:hypothetical protein
MIEYISIPTKSVESEIDDNITNSEDSIDKLVNGVVDTSALLGSAKSLVNSTTASIVEDAEVTLSEIIEKSMPVVKKLKEQKPPFFSAVDLVNTKITNLYNAGTVTSGTLDPESGVTSSDFVTNPNLDEYLEVVTPLIQSFNTVYSSAESAITDIKTLVKSAANTDPAGSFQASLTTILLSAIADVKILSNQGVKDSLKSVGAGVSTSLDRLSSRLADGETADEIIEEIHSPVFYNFLSVDGSNNNGIQTLRSNQNTLTVTLVTLETQVPTIITQLEESAT